MTLGPAASRSSPREAALALWRQMLRQVEAAAKEKQFSRPRREAAEEEEDAEAEDADAEAVANDSGKESGSGFNIFLPRVQGCAKSYHCPDREHVETFAKTFFCEFFTLLRHVLVLSLLLLLLRRSLGPRQDLDQEQQNHCRDYYYHSSAVASTAEGPLGKGRVLHY